MNKQDTYPKICPLINHTKVFCEQENIDGYPLRKGQEEFCRSENGTSYRDLCPMFSAWWHRTKMKEQIKSERQVERQGENR
jgi:hypothetical protein